LELLFMFVIVHSGQTGVERGAHEGAIAAGFKVMGFMAASRRDELGRVPARISTHLTPTLHAGPRAAIRANFSIADGVVVVVPDADNVAKFPATGWIVSDVRALRLPIFVADHETTLHEVSAWAASVRDANADFRLLVTGPRETRWQSGEQVARRIVRGLGVIG
jgi:hypothetical protein